MNMKLKMVFAYVLVIENEPCKQWANSSETPEPEHAKNSESYFTSVVIEQKTQWLERSCWADIKGEPSRKVPEYMCENIRSQDMNNNNI